MKIHFLKFLAIFLATFEISSASTCFHRWKTETPLILSEDRHRTETYNEILANLENRRDRLKATTPSSGKKTGDRFWGWLTKRLSPLEQELREVESQIYYYRQLRRLTDTPEIFDILAISKTLRERLPHLKLTSEQQYSLALEVIRRGGRLVDGVDALIQNLSYFSSLFTDPTVITLLTRSYLNHLFSQSDPIHPQRYTYFMQELRGHLPPQAAVYLAIAFAKNSFSDPMREAIINRVKGLYDDYGSRLRGLSLKQVTQLVAEAILTDTTPITSTLLVGFANQLNEALHHSGLATETTLALYHREKHIVPETIVQAISHLKSIKERNPLGSEAASTRFGIMTLEDPQLSLFTTQIRVAFQNLSGVKDPIFLSSDNRLKAAVRATRSLRETPWPAQGGRRN